MNKDERQTIGINNWIKADGKGAFDWIMRMGKTRLGVKIAVKVNKKYPNDNVLIVVPSIVVKNVWEEEINNFHTELVNYDIITIDSMIKHRTDYNAKLIIIDELHKFTSKARLEAISKVSNNSRYIVALTGTYPYGNRDIERLYPVIDTINEKLAIENKWISKFEEYNVPLELSNADKHNYTKYSTVMFNLLQEFKGLHNVLQIGGKAFFDNDLDLIISAFRGKNVKSRYIKSRHIREAIAMKMGHVPNLNLSNEHHKQIADNWHPNIIKDKVTDFYNAMTKRNELHNINEVKLHALLTIHSLFKDKITITFNESILFADMITDAMNNRNRNSKAISYHSQTKGKPLINFIGGEYFKTKAGKIKNFGKAKQLKYIISMLKLKVYNCINTVRALDEGLDVDTIDLVINTSGTANPMQYSQRTARGKTVDTYNPNKVTLIFNLYFSDFMFIVDGEYKQFKSRDFKKLQERQKYKNVQDIQLENIVNLIQ